MLISVGDCCYAGFTQTLTATEARAERKAALLKKAEEEEKRNSDMWASVRRLVKSPSFQVSAHFVSYLWLSDLTH